MEQFTYFDQVQTGLGEVLEVVNNYNEFIFTLQQKDSEINYPSVFRLYNEGVGFRYEFPDQKKLDYL